MQSVLIGAAAVLVVGAQFVPGHEQSGPVFNAVQAVVAPADSTAPATAATPASGVTAKVASALKAMGSAVKQLSHPKALDDAFGAYFAYRTQHPDDVKKPYLYYVDYGLSSTTPRGYVFDMDQLKVVDGPFMVAHGRGSSASHYGVPTKFSNGSGSAMTSLGLYLTQALYSFTGHTGGGAYSSIGLRLNGVSKGFNDKAFARGVVAHGAPYVTPTGAGRSEGCPAMEPARAQKLLPKLANGAMVFLFAPNQDWMNNDPWVAAAN
jgi:hypothetical protein